MDEGDDVLYLNERTRVFRRHLADGTGSLVCKQPLGPKAVARLRHERRILERLSGVKGVFPPSDRNPSANVIAFDDGDFIPLADAVRGSSLELPALLALALQLADILAAVHSAGVVHKDISPANILLDAEHKPWLIDFDLATTFAEERPGFIQPQEIAGTFPYIAPEQTGRTGRAVDQRADLYALGAVLYELAVGHPPFDAGQGDPLQLVHDILTRKPAAPAALDMRIPATLSDILLRLLEKEPDRRYQSADGLKVDLLRLRDMRARGEHDTFPLGEHDYPLRLLPPSRLVGREKEIGILQSAFDNALHGRGGGILVSGTPGVGKSTLINELRPIVTARRGWFVAGKFDQYRRDLGANALALATQALVDLLLAEPEAELAQDKARILEAMGSNAGLIAALLPDLALMLGVAPEPIDTADQAQAEMRMRQGLLDLLRAIASPQRPLVMVIDDLQWGGAAQIAFIDALLMDEKMRGLLLVCAYREAEVDVTHPLAAMLARWKNLDAEPLQLRLENLPPGDLATLLGEMLHLAPKPAAKLADAIGARTQGNPFDTVELVNALRRDNVLTLGESGWRWDATAIRRHVGKGEVIDLLTARISRLPMQTQAQIDIMACLGGDANAELLAVASGLPAPAVEDALTPALEDGLLVMEAGGKTEGSGAVRFRHDRVQQAAYSRLEPAQRSALHLAIARRLVVLPEFKSMAATSYLAATEAISDPDERRHAAALLRDTAADAFHLSNHVLAERLITAALGLLKGIETTQDAALLIALETEQHVVLYNLGRLDEADEIYRSLTLRCTDPLTLADAACVQMCNLTNRGKTSEALTVGLDLLQGLGLEAPPNIGTAFPGLMDELSRWIYAADRDGDLTRAEADSPRVLAMAKLIDNVQMPAFVCNPMLYPWLVVQSQRLWAESGPCAALMGSLISTPILLVSLREDYETANAAARHLLMVGETRGYEPATSMGRYGFASSVQHWFEPLEMSIGQAQRSHEGLLRSGKLQIACLSYNSSIAALFDSSPTLDPCVTEVEAGLAFAARTGNDYTGACFLSYRQLIQTLRGETQAPGSFDDAGFNEAAYLDGMSGNLMAVTFFHICRALSAVLFGDASTLAMNAAAALPLLANLPGYYPTALARLLHALSLAERIKAAGPEETVALLAEFDTCRDWLAQRAVDAPINFLHLLKWIDAERAWAINDSWSAAAAFDAALVESAARQRPWQRALISERAGLFHLARGLEDSGRKLLLQARNGYQAWGAVAKVQQLERRYAFLPGNSGQRRQTDRQGSNSSVSIDSIDLIGILRASQALSSETSFTMLQARMGELLRELTGATHLGGAMWHEDRQEWCVTPEGASVDNTIPVEAASQQGLLPLSAFNYVVRTREPLLIDDALKDDRFRHDPHFADIECCSLLGVPVFNQGALRVVLLMENRLSHGAFTVDRLEAVNLIAGQLAVSIDNSMLYASLERKVAERTDDLKLANQRLEALSSTDPLTGLANRRRFNDTIESEWQRAIRPQTPIGVAMIDIDQFKLYNDHYGHLGGDECLRRVARALDKSVRGGSDFVARYGGEEFIIVLPGADLDAVRPVAERARAAVEALREPHEKSDKGIVTISVGISAMVPTERNDSEALVELADAALYRAKKNGRNQVAARKADGTPVLDESPIPHTSDKTKPVASGLVGTSVAPPLRVIVIEDSVADAELILRELKRGLEIFQFERVDTADALNAALERQDWDIVICDYHLPSFGALPALALIRQRPNYLPFIIVSGVIREDSAVEAMKLGVDDYVQKSNMARLGPAIRRELKANETRRSNAQAEQLRQTAEQQIRRLNRVLAVRGGINSLIIRARDRDELYHEACRIVVEEGGFSMSLLTIVDRSSMKIAPVASAGKDESLMTAIKNVLASDERAAGTMVARAIREREAVVSNDSPSDPQVVFAGMYAEAGVRSMAVLPLIVLDEAVGAFVLYASEKNFFHAEEMELLTELAGDIAFALDHLDKTAKLDYLAYYDQLTGLANATLFRERLTQHLQSAGSTQRLTALVLLDVERFKTVNDALGRPAGDALLKQLAGRLTQRIGNPDQMAHLGADHFALILPDVKDADQVARIIENEIHCCIDEPFLIEGTDFKAAAKIGIALYPGDGDDDESLFQNAEAALKKAKAGGERYLFYAQHMTERVAERLELENKLRRALEREEFVLHYQPKVALKTGRIVGVEALIRWNDPASGLVPPMQFIPLLEETGLILQVGAWALRRAVGDHKRWLDLGLDAPRIAVNVSAIQLRQSDFVEELRKILAEGMAPPGIDLEITESLIMDDVEGNIGKLKAIRDMGLVIAIDDFGTGYSSLAYLAKLPAGTVKIDRSFIITMLQDPNTMTLVSTIIALAHSLGLEVVAEGVDREEQVNVLRALKCDEMQGYLFSEPVPYEAIPALIARENI